MPLKSEIYAFLGFKKGDGFLPMDRLSPEDFYQLENLPVEWHEHVTAAVARVLGDAGQYLGGTERSMQDEKNDSDRH